MIECIIVGDSIAIGTHRFRPECVAHAQGGINSADWNKQYHDKDLSAETVIISLGSNDWRSINTTANLMRLRENVKAHNVYWILPANKEDRREMVRTVAMVWGDIVLPIIEVSKDHVHPTTKGYRALANSTRVK